MLGEEFKLTVNINDKECKVTILAGEGGTVDYEPKSKNDPYFSAGSSLTISATPNTTGDALYIIDKWYENDKEIDRNRRKRNPNHLHSPNRKVRINCASNLPPRL